MTDDQPDPTEASRRQVLRNLSAGVAGAGALATIGASQGVDAETSTANDDRCEYEYRCRGKMLQRRYCCNFGGYQCDPWEDTNISCG